MTKTTRGAFLQRVPTGPPTSGCPPSSPCWCHCQLETCLLETLENLLGPVQTKEQTSLLHGSNSTAPPTGCGPSLHPLTDHLSLWRSAATTNYKSPFKFHRHSEFWPFPGSRPFWLLFISLTETTDAACLSPECLACQRLTTMTRSFVPVGITYRRVSVGCFPCLSSPSYRRTQASQATQTKDRLLPLVFVLYVMLKMQQKVRL